jgi:hypothetical protein
MRLDRTHEGRHQLGPDVEPALDNGHRVRVDDLDDADAPRELVKSAPRADEDAAPTAVTQLREDEGRALDDRDGVEAAETRALAAPVAGGCVDLGNRDRDHVCLAHRPVEEEPVVRLLDVAVEELHAGARHLGEAHRDRGLARPSLPGRDREDHAVSAATSVPERYASIASATVRASVL